MRRPVILAITACLAGCTAAGPQFAMPSSPVAAGQARLVVYQTGSQIVASDYAVLLDGAKASLCDPAR